MTTPSSSGMAKNKKWLLPAVAGVILVGIGLGLWYMFTPAGITQDSWQWRRVNTQADNIDGIFTLKGKASGVFTITGLEAEGAGLEKSADLPLKVKADAGAYEASFDQTVPTVKPGQKPLQLWVSYRQRWRGGRLGPIMLLP